MNTTENETTKELPGEHHSWYKGFEVRRIVSRRCYPRNGNVGNPTIIYRYLLLNGATLAGSEATLRALKQLTDEMIASGELKAANAAQDAAAVAFNRESCARERAFGHMAHDTRPETPERVQALREYLAALEKERIFGEAYLATIS